MVANWKRGDIIVAESVSELKFVPKVVATTEHPGGIVVDPHNLIAFEDYPFSNDDWLGEGFHSITNPAHEGYGGDGVIWSTVAVKKFEENSISDKIHSSVSCCGLLTKSISLT